MPRICHPLSILWYWWCCWLFCSSQLGVKCTSDELEDFPLDMDANTDADVNEADDFSTFHRRNSSRDEESEPDVVDFNDVDMSANANANEKEDDRIVNFNRIMTTAMKEPTIRRSFGQVLPIIRAMSPTQRLTLATLVLKQLASPSPSSAAAFSPSNLQQLSNKSAELMLPISVDIATMLQSLKTSASAATSHSGRSTAFGTYYYNPLSAGYRVNNVVQRPVLYNVRRRFHTSVNERKKVDNVPPEMMPPPYVPSSNVSYANFNNKKQSQLVEGGDDENENENKDKDSNADADADADAGAGADTDDSKGEYENMSQESVDDYDTRNNDRAITNRAHVNKYNEQCDVFNDNVCNDETNFSYPSERIVNSIQNLQQKHIFVALVEDFVQNATAEEKPEIQRRLGSPISSNREDTMQLCASKIKYARPRKAKSTNGHWKYIVNTDHYTQTVRIETCVNSEKTCSFLNENVKSHCVQIYNYHRLLTWDEKSGLSLDLFKVPTCCSCQVQQANLNAFVPAVVKNSKHAQTDGELQHNVIVDQPNVVYTPPVTKPKTKTKFNLTPLPLTPYNTLKRDSLSGAGGGGKMRKPSQPAVLSLQHIDESSGDIANRYSASGNAIRRTSGKTNILKGVYVPGQGTLTDYTAASADVGVDGGVGASTLPRRVNYNYHPIIDFFRSSPAAANTVKAGDRADTYTTYAKAEAEADADSDSAASTIDEWLPMTEGPRSIKTRRSATRK